MVDLSHDASSSVRIALSGAHGTGKTTLARAFIEQFDLNELPTPGRLMAAEGWPINQQATVTSQVLAWLIQLRLEEASDRWVSMRSLVDICAYGVLALERGSATPLERRLFDELVAVTHLMLPRRYSTLFYLPPRIPLVADEVRSGDLTFQTAADVAIRRYLIAWDLDYVEIDVSEPESVEQATAALRRQITK